MGFWAVVAAVGALASLALSVVLLASVKREKPSATADLEEPTSEAGVAIIKAFGSVTIKGANIIRGTDYGKRDYKVRA